VDYQRFGASLSARLRRRAEHFFSECRRVQRGIHAWRSGDLEGFGALVRESGLSSVHNYECGCPPLISLMEILNESPGVYGARFSGGGFRGSCLAISEPGRRDAIRETVEQSYTARHPNFAGQLEIHFCRGGPGARLEDIP
jgi:galactokinase